jgi:uncharacterized protein YndB with AHSA1/START domain
MSTQSPQGKQLTHRLDRTVLIRATRATVFRYFTDSARFAAWWGTGSTIDARPGGAVVIRYPNAVEAGGEVLEVVPGERIVFTYGYRDTAKPVAWGASRVTVTFADHAQGTVLTLRHDFHEAAQRDAHQPGWRYQLAVFAGVVSGEQNAGLATHVDAWFSAWSSDDAAERARLLGSSTTEGVAFRDAFGLVAGRTELLEHIGAVKTHMPGMRITRARDPRHVQGCALADWEAAGPDGKVAMRGTNVFELAPDGRIAGCVGFGG